MLKSQHQWNINKKEGIQVAQLSSQKFDGIEGQWSVIPAISETVPLVGSASQIGNAIYGILSPKEA